MNRWTTDSSSPDRNRSVFGSPYGCEPRHGMAVELLLGGFRIPGFIEYSASDDQLTFTILRPEDTVKLRDVKNQ